jgi:WD40 repeat protein
VCIIDAGHVATANEDGLVRIWNLTSGRIEGVLGHDDEVCKVAYLPTRDALASASIDGQVRLWNWRNRQPLASWKAHTGAILDLAINPDESRIATASADATAGIWDIDSGQLEVLEHDAAVTTAAFQESHALVTGSGDGAIRRWDSSGRCLQNLHSSREGIRCIAPAGRGRFASGARDGSIAVWRENVELPEFELSLHDDAVSAMLTLRKSDLIVSADESGAVLVWDPRNGAIVQHLEGHFGPVVDIQQLNCDTTLVTAGWDRSVRVWDVAAGRCRHVFRAHSDEITAVRVLDDDTSVVSVGWDSTVRLWRIPQDDQPVPSADEDNRHHDEVAFVTTTPDARFAVSASNDSTLRVWDVRNARCIGLLDGHENWVTHAALTSDGSVLVSASDDHTCRVWLLPAGVCAHVLDGHEHEVIAVVFFDRDRRIASASRDGTVRIWSRDTGENETVLTGHASDIWDLAADPLGRFLVSASQDHSLRVWDTSTWRCAMVLEGLGAMVGTVAISPDGRHIAGGSSSGEVRVWRSQDGKCIHSWRDTENDVLQLLFTLDGRTLISALDDRSIAIRDLESAGLLRRLRGHRDFIECIQLTGPRGRWLASASSDATLRIWDWRSGRCEACFSADCGLGAMAADAQGRYFVVGDASGAVHVLELEGC